MKKFFAGYMAGCLISGVMYGLAIKLGIINIDPKIQAHLDQQRARSSDLAYQFSKIRLN